MTAWRIWVGMALLVCLSAFWVGCQYIETEDGSVFPSVQTLVKEAEGLDLEPGDYADRLHRSKRAAIEKRYEKRLANASGVRQERLENDMDRDLSELDYQYRDVCIKLARREYECSGV